MVGLTLFAVTASAQQPAAIAAQQPKTFPRNYVLVEKHTGDYCLNCPAADDAFLYYLQQHPEHEGRFVEIRHNSYQQFDRYYLTWLKDFAATWSINDYPNYLMDRCNYHGTKSGNPNSLKVVWQDFGFIDPLQPLLERPSYVSISLDGSFYDPTSRQLVVHVSGEVTKALPDLCINIFLVQDDDKYENTTRDFLTTSVNGDPLTVADGRYDATYTTTIADSYGFGPNATMQRLPADPAKLKVVAFVSSFDNYSYPAPAGGKDFTDSEVHNTTITTLTDLPQSDRICAKPIIMLNEGRIAFRCATVGATYSYTIAPVTSTATSPSITDADMLFSIKVVAKAEGYANSPASTATFSLKDLIGGKGDIDGNGRVDKADVERLVDVMLGKH